MRGGVLAARSTRRPPFTPLSIPGCVGWFDANDIGAAYAEAAALTVWRNKTGIGGAGAGGDLSVAYTAFPTFRENVRNGLSVVRFAKASSQGIGSGGGAGGTALNIPDGTDKPVSVFAAFAQSSNDTRQDVCAWARVANDIPNYDVQCNFAASFIGAGLRDNASATSTASLTGVVPDTNWHVLAACNAGTATDITVDGVTQALAQTSNVGAMTITRFAIGALPRLTPTNFFNGDIGEVIFYDRYLATTERQLVERYLGRKWRVFV